MIITTILNIVVWYIFVFIAVVWVLLLFKNQDNFKSENRRLVNPPHVSILIPAYNEEDTIEETIKSVLSLNYPKEKREIIVINDCSRDRTGEIAEKYAKKGLIKLMSNKVNKGKAWSLNRAISVSKGEFIACMDADSFVERDALMKMMGDFTEDNIACVTPALKVHNPKNMLEKIQYAEYLLNVFLRKMLAFLDAIHVTPGVFSIYRKSVLKKVGGFDVGNLTEDMEIALRLHDHGYKIENNFDASSYTVCPDGWRQLLRQRIRWYRGAVRNTVKYRHMLFNRKYGNIGVFLLPMNFISVIAIMFIFFIALWNIGTTMANSAWKMSLIGWDMSIFFSNIKIESLFSNILTTPLILSLVGIVIGGYILYKSFKLNDQSVRENKYGYVLYLLFFPFTLMLFWTLAIIYESLNLEKKW